MSSFEEAGGSFTETGQNVTAADIDLTPQSYDPDDSLARQFFEERVALFVCARQQGNVEELYKAMQNAGLSKGYISAVAREGLMMPADSKGGVK